MFWRRFRQDRAAIIGLIIVSLNLIVAVIGPFVAPYNPFEQHLVSRRAAPSLKHLMGTDAYGRDIFSRVLYGARITIAVGLFVIAISLFTGMVLGVVAGNFGNHTDTIIMRSMDFLLSFPYFFLAILIVAILGPNLFNAAIAVLFTFIPQYARVVRSATLSIKKEQYIEAARAMGSSNFRRIVEHIIPNLIGPVIVLGTTGVATAVILVSALSFLGMGAQPPTAEWGLMVSEGRSYVTSHPHITIFPGVVLALFVLGINLVGDGLRDVLDPKFR
jgi:ABC-type dipeptide/oligopeptide/nickel transport system permease subunit